MEKKSTNGGIKKGIGQTLREEREKMGLTHEQVCEITKLRPSILDAIEKEAWDKLPPSVFVKGFIKSYAQILDLDPETLIKMYSATEHAKQSHTITKEESKSSKKGTFIWLSFIVFIMVFVLLSVLGIKKYQIFKKRLKAPAQKNINKMDTTIFIEEPIRFPVILEAKIRKKTWLKIAGDRYEEEKYLLQAGEYISWQVRDNFELVAGDAGGIDLWLNNMPIHFNKKNGQMLCLRLYSKKHKGVNKI